MPSNVGPALGVVAQVFADRLAQKHKEERDDQMKRFGLISGLVTSGLQNGAVEDPNAAIQFLIENAPGKSGKAGKGGGGLPPQVQNLIGGITRAGQQGGQPAGLPRFKTSQQMQQEQDTALRTREGIQSEGAGQRTSAELEAKKRLAERWIAGGMKEDEAYERVGLKQPQPKAPQPERDITPDPSSPTGYSRRYLDAQGNIVRVEPAPAPASTVTKPGTIGEFFKQREKELGHTLTTTELAAAATDWNKANLHQTPEQKAEAARALASYRQQIGAPQADSVLDEAQVISLGGQDQQYLNLDTFTGEKSKNAAREAAHKAGIPVVTKQEASQLEGANTALGSLNAFFDTMKDKMPPDAAGRPLAQIEIPMKQLFQTDEDLAAAVAWNITVLPQLRAMSITGRVPVFEYQQALNAQPKLTDTVGTAAKKMGIVQGVLERGAKSILTRPNQKPKPDASGPKVPPDVSAALKDKPNGRRYRVGGVVYEKASDGTVTPAKQQ